MAKLSKKMQTYLEKKQRDLTDAENTYIRERIEREPNVDVYGLAKEIGCVPVQIAGVKSAVTKGH